MDPMTELKRHENEARRLRAEYASDPVVRLLVEVDLAIGTTARRVLAWMDGGAGRRPESR